MNFDQIQAAIEDWWVIFKLETGVEAPHTSLHEDMFIEASEYDGEIMLGYLDAPECAEILPFVWFHEAYHHLQYAIEGIEDDRARDIVGGSSAYYDLPAERAANKFAYKVCKAYNIPFEVPEWLPQGYDLS